MNPRFFRRTAALFLTAILICSPLNVSAEMLSEAPPTAPTAEIVPADEPAPTETPASTETPVSTEAPAPSETPASTEAPAPSETPVSTEAPAPTEIVPDPVPSAAPVSVLPEVLPRLIIGVGDTLPVWAEEEPELPDSLTCRSDSTKIAAVDETGRVTAKKTGSTVVFIETADGARAEIPVTVKKAPSSVKLSMKRTKLGVGETASVAAALSSGSAGSVFFSSSDPNVASVDADGLLTANGVGTCTVTAKTHNKKQAKLTVTIAPAPTEITLNRTDLRMGMGESYTLRVQLNAGAAGGGSFFSSDESVAVIDAGGQITAVGLGSCTLTAEAYNHVRAECTLTVCPAPEALSLSAEATTLGVGDSIDLIPVFAPENAAAIPVFSTSAKKVASVSADGTVKALAAGSAVITAKLANGLTASVKITVKRAPTAVTLSADRTTLGVGECVFPKLTFPKNTFGRCTLSVSDPEVLSIDADGSLNAMAPGTAAVRATAYNGKSAEMSVTVCPAPESISANEALTLGVGETHSAEAALNAGSAGEIRYESSDSDVASVGKNGQITAKGLGTAVIRSETYNGLSAETAVTVVPAPTSLSIGGSKRTVGVGDSFAIRPVITEGSHAAISYTSSKPAVAQVSADGTVTAQKTGSTVITVKTHNGKSAKLTVTVQKAPSSITASPASMKMGVGEMLRLSASLPQSTAASLTFSSDDASVAEVDDDGYVYAIAPGQTSIRITAHNGVSAACAVTVCSAPTELMMDLPEVIGINQQVPLSVRFHEGEYANIRFSVIAGNGASIDAKNVLTVKKTGRVRIRAATANPDLFIERVIEVKGAPNWVAFSESTYFTVAGETLRLTPVIAYNAATKFTFSIVKGDCIRLSADGTVEPLALGTATVQVKTSNGKKATATVRVVDPAYPVRLTLPQSVSYLKEGERVTLSPTVYPTSAEDTLTWSSDHPEIASVDPESGEVTAHAYGLAVITAQSAANPTLALHHRVIVYNDDICLVMPDRRTSLDELEANLGRIDSVEATAIRTLDQLYADGTISAKEYERRRSTVENAFGMYRFPWMTDDFQPYWKEANAENGAKDFKPGIVYYGVPYISGSGANRTYTVEKLLAEDRYIDSGEGFWTLNQTKPLHNSYCGCDCSSFVSAAIWGTNQKNSAARTKDIETSSLYATVKDRSQLRPGDLFNWGGHHVVMFLYYANEARTQMVIIEQGGSEAAISTVSASVHEISDYSAYTVRRPKN